MSVPVLAAVALHYVGALHPIGFPHFVASMVIACLISTTFSSVCNLWVALDIGQSAFESDQALAADADVGKDLARLRRFARLLPALAVAVPVVAASMYLHFFRPWEMVPGAAKALELYLVGLIALGGYGFVLCRAAVKRLGSLAISPAA